MRYQYTFFDNPNGLKQGHDYEVLSIHESAQGVFATVLVETGTGKSKVTERTSHFRRTASPNHVIALPETPAAKVFGLAVTLYICELQMRSGIAYVKCKVLGAGIKQPPGHLKTFNLERNFKLLDE